MFINKLKITKFSIMALNNLFINIDFYEMIFQILPCNISAKIFIFFSLEFLCKKYLTRCLIEKVSGVIRGDQRVSRHRSGGHTSARIVLRHDIHVTKHSYFLTFSALKCLSRLSCQKIVFTKLLEFSVPRP